MLFADIARALLMLGRRGGVDVARRYDASVNGLSSYFVWLNRGKRSIRLNLKTEEGREVLLRLVGESDVVAGAAGWLTRGGYGRRGLPISGPEVLTPADMVRIIGAAIGRHITLIPLTEDEARGAVADRVSTARMALEEHVDAVRGQRPEGVDRWERAGRERDAVGRNFEAFVVNDDHLRGETAA